MGSGPPEKYYQKIEWAAMNLFRLPKLNPPFPTFKKDLTIMVKDGKHLHHLLQSTATNEQKVLALDFEFCNKKSYDGERNV